MTIFVTVVTLDVSQVPQVFLLLLFAGVNCIASASWGGFPGLFFFLLLLQLLFPFLPSLLRAFNAFKTVKRGCFLSLSLRFFNLRVFHMTTLALSGNGVGWPCTPRTMLVDFTNSGARPKCHLGLVIDCFLYRVLKAVQFVAVLLYFGPD